MSDDQWWQVERTGQRPPSQFETSYEIQILSLFPSEYNQENVKFSRNYENEWIYVYKSQRKYSKYVSGLVLDVKASRLEIFIEKKGCKPRMMVLNGDKRADIVPTSCPSNTDQWHITIAAQS